MSGKCQKIHIQILYIHCHMGNALGSVCHEISACLMCQLRKTLDIIFAAQHIGYLGHSNDLRSFAQCLLKGFTTAPVLAAACCQGRRLLWCSIMLTRISSPGFSTSEPKL